MSEKRKTSNLVLLIIGIFILAFIVAMTVIFCVMGSTPDTLIQYTLGAGGLEVLLLAAIKISKVVSGERVKKSVDEDMESIEDMEGDEPVG